MVSGGSAPARLVSLALSLSFARTCSMRKGLSCTISLSPEAATRRVAPRAGGLQCVGKGVEAVREKERRKSERARKIGAVARPQLCRRCSSTAARAETPTRPPRVRLGDVLYVAGVPRVGHEGQQAGACDTHKKSQTAPRQSGERAAASGRGRRQDHAGGRRPGAGHTGPGRAADRQAGAQGGRLHGAVEGRGVCGAGRGKKKKECATSLSHFGGSSSPPFFSSTLLCPAAAGSSRTPGPTHTGTLRNTHTLLQPWASSACLAARSPAPRVTGRARWTTWSPCRPWSPSPRARPGRRPAPS